MSNPLPTTAQRVAERDPRTDAATLGDLPPQRLADVPREVVRAEAPASLPSVLRTVVSDPRLVIPKRVEIRLTTPVGAIVSLFLTRSNGDLRAQLSTSDPVAFQWLQSQVASLRETPMGVAVAWLPPQREDPGSSHPGSRDPRERRRPGTGGFAGPAFDVVDSARHQPVPNP